MPRPPLDRFTSQSMSDCEFCSPEGRRFRTQRQCSVCSRHLCLVCRPWVPQAAYLCPDCGGGTREDALHEPGASIERLTAAGLNAPFWLLLMQDRLSASKAASVDEEIVPE